MTADRTGHRADALAEYAAGALPEPERASVEAHLAGCSSCRAALAGWIAVAAAVAPPVDPPPGSVMASAAILSPRSTGGITSRCTSGRP